MAYDRLIDAINLRVEENLEGKEHSIKEKVELHDAIAQALLGVSSAVEELTKKFEEEQRAIHELREQVRRLTMERTEEQARLTERARNIMRHKESEDPAPFEEVVKRQLRLASDVEKMANYYSGDRLSRMLEAKRRMEDAPKVEFEWIGEEVVEFGFGDYRIRVAPGINYIPDFMLKPLETMRKKYEIANNFRKQLLVQDENRRRYPTIHANQLAALLHEQQKGKR